MIALTPEEADAMRRYDKILAIKMVMSRTFIGLREAKDYVDRWDGKTVTTDPAKSKPCPHCDGTGFVKDE